MINSKLSNAYTYAEESNGTIEIAETICEQAIFPRIAPPLSNGEMSEKLL